MNLSKSFKYLFLPAFAVTMLTLLFFLTASAASVDSVVISSEQINVSASLEDSYESYKTDIVYLFELTPAQSASNLTGISPAAEAASSEKLSFSLPFSKNETHRLTHHFAIAVKDENAQYKAISDSKYVSNPEFNAANTYDYPSFDSKKGLQIQLMSDAQNLGISHTVITVPINTYILAADDGSCIETSCNGHTFYLSAPKIELLDHKIRVMSEAGINIFLNIVLTAQESGSEDLSYLYASPQSPGGSTMYALNTSNEKACSCFTAFIKFISERYTRQDRQYGFAASYIIGYEVNNNRLYNYAGEMELKSYADIYSRQLRMADSVARSVYANARVYASVANNFNVLSSVSGSSNELTDYPAKEFLDTLDSVISGHGDFPWNISVDPYPSDLTNASVWIDAKANDDISTEFITIKNIEVFVDYISGKNFLYNGSIRRILIGDFGISGEAGTDNEKLQAASYAYSYYKAASIDSIEAIIYHRQADTSTEPGMYFGMRSALETASGENKKALYNVFKYIDTNVISNSASADEYSTDRLLSVIGAESWDSLIPGFNPKKVRVKSLYEFINTQSADLKGELEAETLYDFSGDNFYDFYPTDNSKYIEFKVPSGQSDKCLYAKMYDTYPQEYMGIGRAYRNFSISNARYISVNLMVETPSDLPTVNVVLRMTGYGKNNEFITYNATSQTASGKWTELYFNIESFLAECSEIKSMKILIKSPDSASYSGGYGIWLKNISVLYNKTPVGVIISLSLSAAAIIAASIVTVIFIKKRHKRPAKKVRVNKNLKKNRIN